jgi:hypothetical protein
LGRNRNRGHHAFDAEQVEMKLLDDEIGIVPDIEAELLCFEVLGIDENKATLQISGHIDGWGAEQIRIELYRGDKFSISIPNRIIFKKET